MNELEWMPMESAPKDGTMFVACGLRHGNYGYTADRRDVAFMAWRVRHEYDRKLGRSIDRSGFDETHPTGAYGNGFTPYGWIALPKDLRSTKALVEGTLDPVLAEALNILDQMTDMEPCRYDHHGYCQAHGLHMSPCPHERAKKLFAQLKANAADKPTGAACRDRSA